MAAVAGVRLARASAGQLIELVVSAAGLAGFLVGLIDSLVADEASLLWVCDRICGCTGKSAAIAAPAMATATAPATSVSAPARRGVLRRAVMVRIRLLARQQGG